MWWGINFRPPGDEVLAQQVGVGAECRYCLINDLFELSWQGVIDQFADRLC